MSQTESERPQATILGHLDELRERLIKAVAALVVATLFSFFYASRLLKLLIAPAGAIKPVFLTPTEGFLTYMRVALLGGTVLALPVIAYQLVRFVLPALKESEAKTLLIAVPGAIVSFLVGVAFAYFAMLPFALRYLVLFGAAIAEVAWAIGRYIDFVTTLMFWVGIIFEAPLVIYFLAKLGIVNTAILSRNRRYAILVSAILAAAITPTADPFNMLLLMVPLVLLYEIGILASRLA